MCVLPATACTGASGEALPTPPAESPSGTPTTEAATPSPSVTPQAFRPKKYACAPRRTPEVSPASPDEWRTEAPRSPAGRRSQVTLGLKARKLERKMKVVAAVQAPRRSKPITREAVLRRGKWARVTIGKPATRRAGIYTVIWRDARERFISCDGFFVKKG